MKEKKKAVPLFHPKEPQKEAEEPGGEGGQPVSAWPCWFL